MSKVVTTPETPPLVTSPLLPQPQPPLPRVLRRALGLMNFARRCTGASATSLFIVDRGGKTLRGQVSDWDWTRTSFVSHLRDWPTVAQALKDGKPRSISKGNASGSEVVWFEPRGIESTYCVPMCIEGRSLGILFFDFDADITKRESPPVDLALLIDVGERCARAIMRPPAFAPNAASSTDDIDEEIGIVESSPVIHLE